MKILLILILMISIIPASLLTMIYGWGLEPQNWGWISFGYVCTLGLPMIAESFK